MDKMIKNTLLVTLSFIILHILFIRIVDPWWNTSQNNQQQNLIKAQKYIYSNDTDRKNVIIGSSLSFRIKGEGLKGYTNLSMLGMGISESLQIISGSQNYPDTLFIEMNVAFKSENTEFLNRLYKPVLYEVKGKVPILRAENQPVGITGSLFKYFVVDKILKKIEKLYAGKDNENDFRNQILDKMIEEQSKNYSKVPDKEYLDQHFEKLLTYINGLKGKGVEIVFFEMPVNCRLCELPLATATREYFHRYFPPESNMYIPLPDCAKYTTTDGVHLTAAEATLYTTFFKARSKELKSFN